MARSNVSIILQRPKYIQNLGAIVRACACFQVNTIYWTGDRLDLETVARLPRELRMKAYQTVRLIRTERPFDLIEDATPVCIELLENAQSLPVFAHPSNAAYVFGPEDGSVSQVFRRLCHQFVSIPSRYCVNLAAACNIVLYDRVMKHASKR